MADLPAAELTRRQRDMRALNDVDRAAAIAASANVIGFERFNDRARQEQLRASYRCGHTEQTA